MTVNRAGRLTTATAVLCSLPQELECNGLEIVEDGVMVFFGRGIRVAISIEKIRVEETREEVKIAGRPFARTQRNAEIFQEAQ